jgi:hypothetical protein
MDRVYEKRSLSSPDNAQQQGNNCQNDKKVDQASGMPGKNTQQPANDQDHRNYVQQVSHDRKFNVNDTRITEKTLPAPLTV